MSEELSSAYQLMANILRTYPELSDKVFPLFDRCLKSPENTKETLNVVTSPFGLPKVLAENLHNSKISDNVFNIYQKHQKSFDSDKVVSCIQGLASMAPHLAPKVLETVKHLDISPDKPEVGDRVSLVLNDCARNNSACRLQTMDAYGELLAKDPGRHKDMSTFLYSMDMTDAKSASKGLDLFKQFYEQYQKDPNIKDAGGTFAISAQKICDIAQKFPELSDKVLDTLECGLKCNIAKELYGGSNFAISAILQNMAMKNPDKLDKIDSARRLMNSNLPADKPLSQRNQDGSVSVFDYHPNNALKSKTTYKEGKSSGEFITALEDGSRIETNYVNGKEDGRKLFYDPDGSVQIQVYNEGKLTNLSPICPETACSKDKDNVLNVMGQTGALKVYPDGTALEFDVKNKCVTKTNKDRSCQKLTGKYALQMLRLSTNMDSKDYLKNFDKCLKKQTENMVIQSKMRQGQGNIK